jgi:hypothetical protein
MILVPWIFLFLGAIARIFLPFLIARRDDPSLSWDWQYVWPQVLSVLIFILILPLLVDDLAGVGDLDWQFAWLVGYGAASFGRLSAKGGHAIVMAVRNGR